MRKSGSEDSTVMLAHDLCAEQDQDKNTSGVM